MCGGRGLTPQSVRIWLDLDGVCPILSTIPNLTDRPFYTARPYFLNHPPETASSDRSLTSTTYPPHPRTPSPVRVRHARSSPVEYNGGIPSHTDASTRTHRLDMLLQHAVRSGGVCEEWTMGVFVALDAYTRSLSPGPHPPTDG